MKMPRDVRLDSSGRDPGTVYFETARGEALGLAYRSHGEHETHYDVVEARKLQSAPAGGRAMAQDGSDVGSFIIRGQVGFFFDDGVAVVEACGFDFWVAPDEIEESLELGSWVQLGIRNLTLYV